MSKEDKNREKEGWTYIDGVDEIDPVFIKSSGPVPSKKDLERAEIPREQIERYREIFKKSRWKRIWSFARSTISGENELGFILGQAKNIASWFVPYGSQINSITDYVGSKFKTKQRGNMNWILNRLREPSTWRGIIVAATGLGVSLSPDLADAIVSAGVALFALLEIATNEGNDQEEGE